jgi:hypothetical protein
VAAVGAVLDLDTSQQRTLSNTNMTDITESPLDKHQPVTIDNKPIKYNDNPATIPGIMAAFEDWSERTGSYEILFQHNGVLIPSTGKIAVDSVDSVKFYNGTINDPRSFSDPAPPTPKRIAEINAKEPDKSKHITPSGATTFAPNEPFVFSPPLVQQERRYLHKSWTFVLGSAESTRSCLKEAKGDGIVLMLGLRNLYTKCTEADKALVTASHNALVAAGIKSDLALESFREFLEKYEDSKLTLHPWAPPLRSHRQRVAKESASASSTTSTWPSSASSAPTSPQTTTMPPSPSQRHYPQRLPPPHDDARSPVLSCKA